MTRIGDTVSAFLNVQAGVNSSSSITKLQAGQIFARDLLKPMETAFGYTGEMDANPTRAKWCEIAQKHMSGIKTSDVDRIDMISVYETVSKSFEDSRVGYTPVVNTDHVQFNVSGHNNYYDKVTQAANMCTTPA